MTLFLQRSNKLAREALHMRVENDCVGFEDFVECEPLGVVEFATVEIDEAMHVAMKQIPQTYVCMAGRKAYRLGNGDEKRMRFVGFCYMEKVGAFYPAKGVGNVLFLDFNNG